MAITRKSLANTIDEYDAEIATLQESKRETFQAYRDQVTDAEGKEAAKAELEAVKKAIRRRQAATKKGAEVVEAADALADEVFEEITAARAPRATPAIANGVPDRDERRRQRFSESMDDTKALSAEAVADGLISPEAHAETVRLSDALADKFGNGPLPDQESEAGRTRSESASGAASDEAPNNSPEMATSGHASGNDAPNLDGSVKQVGPTADDDAGGDHETVSADQLNQAADAANIEIDNIACGEPAPLASGSDVEPVAPLQAKSAPHNDDPRCLDKAKCGEFSNFAFCMKCRDAWRETHPVESEAA